MKKIRFISISSIFFVLTACDIPFSVYKATPSPQIVSTSALMPTEKPGWKLVFQDEFNDSSLSSSWDTEYWWGRLNPPELQYYAPDAFNLKDGFLQMKSEKRFLAGQNYTSGLISSLSTFNFTFGYAEIRCKMPDGKGLWPAFWLLTVHHPETGEIDVFENLGDKPDVVYLSWHTTDVNGKSQSDTQTFSGSDFSSSFHTFAVDWQKDVVIWYVDGIERNRLIRNIPQTPMYVIANLAVGGEWPGAPDASTHFPASFEVDYIRVYQRK